MKKLILNPVLFLLLLAGIFHSCISEDLLLPGKENLSPEVAKAQAWYDKQAKKEGIQLVAADERKQSPLLPDWRITFSNENDEYKVTEVNLGKTVRKKQTTNKSGNNLEGILEYEERFVIVSPECMKKFQETNDKRYLAFDIRLIIRTNKETDKADGFVMVIYPDLSYLEAHLDRPFRDISYLKRDSEFSGVIYYHDMGGNYVNGWKYIDGKAYALYHTKEEMPQE